MKCRDITSYMEENFPLDLAEDWDNVGLILGSGESTINKAMVCLDVTPTIVSKAIDEGVDLIISHHPLIFKGLKKINKENDKEKLIYKLIQNDINVYTAHTNLDVGKGGLNEYLAQKIGLASIGNLSKHKRKKIYKITVFVPNDNIDNVRKAMCSAGAGWIGNYSCCTFAAKGLGTFKPLEGTNPHIGELGRLEYVEEYKLETIVVEDRIQEVIKKMESAHPYEEVAYDIFELNNISEEFGLGKVGVLKKPQNSNEFIKSIKKELNIKNVRIVGEIPSKINKVAVFCGSFDGNLKPLISQDVDVLVTGDLKYHTALDMVNMGLCAIDAGHFSTEIIMIERVCELLKAKFPGIEILTEKLETDPFTFA